MNKVLLFIGLIFINMLDRILLSKVDQVFVFLRVKHKAMVDDLYPRLLTYKD